MPEEPVNTNASELPEHMQEDVDILKKSILAFAKSQDLSTYTSIFYLFDELFSACQNCQWPSILIHFRPLILIHFR